jgi:flagellar assembly protein FliH
LSNLIKREVYPQVKIRSFDAQEVGQLGSWLGEGRPDGPAVLPVTGGRRPAPGKPAESAQERLARLEREAYEKGFEQGQKDGLSLGEKRVQETLSQMEALLRAMTGLKKQVYGEAEAELLRLSVEIARQIIRREITTDPSVVTRAIRAALEYLGDQNQVRVSVNPEDMKEVQRQLPDLAQLFRLERFELVEDRAVTRGGCTLETGFGRINGTIEDQLAMLREELERCLGKG